LHDTAQATVLTVPDVGAAVSDLRQRYADGLQCGDLIVLVEVGVALGKLGLGRDDRRLARIGGEVGTRAGGLLRRLDILGAGELGEEP
jgi:hypothetical protein